MFMKRLLGILGILVLTFTLIPITEAQQPGPREKIRITYAANSLTFIVMYLAHDLGLYAQNGLDAEMVMVGPSVGTAALLNGDADYIQMLTSAIRIAGKGAPVRAVSATLPALFLAMVSQPQYKDVRELNGKIIGVSFFGGLHHLSTKRLLKHFGVEPDRQAKIIPLGDQKLLYQALKIGRVDAVMVDPPFSVMLKREAFPVLARVGDVFPIPSGGLGATLRKINENRAQVKRVLRAETKALASLRSDPQAVKQLMQKRFGLDAQMTDDTYNFIVGIFSKDGRVPRHGVEVLLDLEKENGAIPKSVTVDQVVDFSLMEEVIKEQ